MSKKKKNQKTNVSFVKTISLEAISFTGNYFSSLAQVSAPHHPLSISSDPKALGVSSLKHDQVCPPNQKQMRRQIVKMGWINIGMCFFCQEES